MEESIKGDALYLPKPSPLHPFPDLFNYSPKDYYDLSKGVSAQFDQQFNYDRAYGLGNIDEYKQQQESAKIKHRTYKANAGRPLKRKKWFSTWNKAVSLAPPLCFYLPVEVDMPRP